MKSEKLKYTKYTIGSLFDGKLVLGLLYDKQMDEGYLLVADEESGWDWSAAKAYLPNVQQRFEQSYDLECGRKVLWKFVLREQIMFTDEIVDESFSNIVNEINNELYDR